MVDDGEQFRGDDFFDDGSIRPIRPPNRLKIVALLTPAALATSSSGTVRPRPWKAPIAAARICSELRLASARSRDAEGTAPPEAPASADLI